MRRIVAKLLMGIFTLMTVLLLCGCNDSNPQLKATKELLSKAFTIPNNEISGIYDVNEPEQDKSNMRSVVSHFLGSSVSEKLIDDCLNLSSDLMLLHFQAIRRNTQIAVSEIQTIEKSSENRFSYVATVKVTDDSGKKDDMELSGSVQFDSQGKIELVSINSRDFKLFMEK